jgi:hypothetical protein
MLLSLLKSGGSDTSTTRFSVLRVGDAAHQRDSGGVREPAPRLLRVRLEHLELLVHLDVLLSLLCARRRRRKQLRLLCELFLLEVLLGAALE